MVNIYIYLQNIYKETKKLDIFEVLYNQIRASQRQYAAPFGFFCTGINQPLQKECYKMSLGVVMKCKNCKSDWKEFFFFFFVDVKI